MESLISITSVAVSQPLESLEAVNNKTPNALLYYINAIPEIVELSDDDILIAVNDSNLQLHSRTLNDSVCKNATVDELCQETEGGHICATFDLSQMCNTGGKQVTKLAAFYGLKTGVKNALRASNVAYQGWTQTNKIVGLNRQIHRRHIFTPRSLCQDMPSETVL